MFPVFELVCTHVKFATLHLPQANITATCFEFSFLKAHWLTSIAATTALVKHQWTMQFDQTVDQ
nr:hypothetical protein [Pseudobacter ginsenosidimutans]